MYFRSVGVAVCVPSVTRGLGHVVRTTVCAKSPARGRARRSSGAAATAREAVLRTARGVRVPAICDHRTVDGATGAQFLQTLKGYVENPVTMLV